jgi:hypothetical protein
MLFEERIIETAAVGSDSENLFFSTFSGLKLVPDPPILMRTKEELK